jgi:hypothetical protein
VLKRDHLVGETERSSGRLDEPVAEIVPDTQPDFARLRRASAGSALRADVFEAVPAWPSVAFKCPQLSSSAAISL